MEENVYKTHLYRWQRQEKPRVLSRSNHIKSTDDIADWIKKVEEATDKATDVAFGLMPSGKQKGKVAVHQLSGQVRDNELALNEAQDLLSQWMNEKVRFDYDDGFDDLEAWRRARKNKDDILKKNGCEINEDDMSLERLTRMALEEEVDVDETAIYERVKRNALGDRDPYENLYELDESEAVQSVLKTMLSKEMVKDTFKKDLGLQKEPRTDPRTKMELRHKMVKENREKREKEGQKKKGDAQLKKEARLQAQQLLLKEQKEREIRARKEEMEMKKEMAKIRKEMHEERRKREEEIRREREEEEQLNKLAREELERQRAQEDRDILLTQRLENERKFKQLMKMEVIKSRITSKNLQCLHRHFTAWYDLVLSRRLLLGKVKAMSDWKLMLKIWGAWRSHVRSQKLDVEAEKHEREMIDSQKQMLKAVRHWTISTLRQCFLTWQLFAKECGERKELEKEQEQTKNKMMSLLKAVAEGKVGKQAKLNETLAPTKKTVQLGKFKDTQSDDLTIVSIEDQESSTPVVKLAWGESENAPTFRSETSISGLSESVSSRGRSLPKEPWQVTHQHLKLSKKDISNLTAQDGVVRQHTDLEIRKRFGTQPWMNKHFVANNFEHRYNAQQQTLKEQQNQLREQKRLIEELQYEQKQQSLKQRLAPGTVSSPLPPLEVLEVPPPGTQIPRGDNSVDAGKQNGKVTVEKNACQEINTKPGDVSGDETDRARQTTSRSEVTSVSQGTSSTACQNTKYLQVLKNMEQRAAERARIKAEREDKKRQQEEEKLAQIQKEQQEKLMEIEAEKRAKAAAYRQKKLLEKQKEEEKKRQEALLEEKNKIAEEHYRKAILKYRGLLPFKKLISLSKRNWLKSVKHRDKEILKKCFKAWKKFAAEERQGKEHLADQMHQFLVIKHSFHSWRNFKYHIQLLERRAERHYQDNLKTKLFQAWVEWVIVEKENFLSKMALASQHYVSNLTRRTFNDWRYLKERQKREEERQARKLELRKKVASLIPDYAPPVSDSVHSSEDIV
ncbi:coiled-coil domain-containing protein [Biomphalaria glabrata]|nr:putative coiled-coil domain-containing protein [Biomphalaria glabrata]